MAIEKTIARDSVEHLESTNTVRDNSDTQPFDKLVRRAGAKTGTEEVVPAVDDRLDTSVEGVGSGIRYLIFGPVITVDHTVTRNRAVSIVSEPNVTLDQLITVVPRTMTVPVALDGQGYTKEFPVGIGHSEVSMD